VHLEAQTLVGYQPLELLRGSRSSLALGARAELRQHVAQTGEHGACEAAATADVEHGARSLRGLEQQTQALDCARREHHRLDPAHTARAQLERALGVEHGLCRLARETHVELEQAGSTGSLELGPTHELSWRA
jgi:hypothetical protein